MLVHQMKFKVHGVTFPNENQMDIQQEIQKILNEYKRNNYFDEFYCGYSKKEIIEMELNVSEYEGILFNGTIKEDIYNNQKCYKVYIDTFNNSKFHVGYVPKENIEELSQWNSKPNLKVITNIYVTGGKCKHCVYKNEDYQDKYDVEIETLNYGFNVELRFCNNFVATPTINTNTKKCSFLNKLLKKLKG